MHISVFFSHAEETIFGVGVMLSVGLAEGDTAAPIGLRGDMSKLCPAWSQKIKAFH